MAHGFDAESNEYVDMMQAGIIDPTKVERVALQNAASIASLLLTTEALITDIPEKAAMPPMPDGGDYEAAESILRFSSKLLGDA